MTNTRAILLVIGNASISIVDFIMAAVPTSRSTEHYYGLGSAVFHTFSIMIGFALYFQAYRSVKRTVENLNIETNFRKPTEVLENFNAVGESKVEENADTLNYPQLLPSNDIFRSCKDQSAGHNEDKLISEGPDSVRYGPGKGLCSANVSNDYRGKNIDSSISNTGSGLEKDPCVEASNNRPEKDLSLKRTNNVPSMDPCGTALAVTENDEDMLVDDKSSGPSADPCGTAKTDLNNELRIDVDLDGTVYNSNEKGEKVLFQGITNEFQCHKPANDVTFEIAKPLEKSLEAMKQEPRNISSKGDISSKQELRNISSEDNISSKQEPRNKSLKEKPRNILRHTHNALQNKKDIEMVHEEQHISGAKFVSGHERGATVDQIPKNIRRRPDQEFAKAVLLINVGILVCYVPGLLLYYVWLLLGVPMTDSVFTYGAIWTNLLNYLNSTLNAIIFISCSSELRLYTKSVFTRIIME